MTQYSPAATLWLQGFAATERLQQDIFASLKAENVSHEPDGDGDGSDDSLSDLIQQQDTLIRQLPFDRLTLQDVEVLKSKIARLQTNHQTLVEAISIRRQSLLDQSSQSKKANRSIKAYQQAQDL
ncbi:hypothetical protein [Amphritea japonica]|uniref:hypothetical protein n=1 Tax=Amphritea japonica TaxID=452627 RepID=UPI00037C6938|nr:hypothetical protein [Amphritea japonica]